MSLELDDKLDLAGARIVRLAGHEFHVAPLSLRQILAIADHVPKLSAIAVDNISSERLTPLAEVLWHGLRRAHPKLSRDEFLDLPITIAELIGALPVVIEQAGGRKADAGDYPPPQPSPTAGPTAGEGAAAMASGSTQ